MYSSLGGDGVAVANVVVVGEGGAEGDKVDVIVGGFGGAGYCVYEAVASSSFSSSFIT